MVSFFKVLAIAPCSWFKLATGLLFAATVGLAPGAAAEQASLPSANAPALSPVVHTLDTPRGVAAVYQRVQTIAERSCVRVADIAAPLSAAERQCRNQVLEQLLSKLADPYLSYLHANPDELLVAQR